PGVADVDPLVDSRAADVDADRARRRRQLAETARVGVKEPHRPSAAPLLWVGPRAGRPAPARGRGRVAPGQRQPQRLQVAADGLQLADELAGGVMVEPVTRTFTELLEALQCRTGLVRQLNGLGLEHPPSRVA